MASSLCWMVKNYHGEWLDMPNVAPRFALKGKQYSTLKHWGFVEPCPKKLGLWRPTQNGIDFANGAIYAPRYTYLYNDTILANSDESTNIKEALGDKFDYNELMQPSPVPGDTK